jgi:hypothetical protein
MALIITGIFIQLLGLAVQLIQLQQGRSDDPGAQAPVPGTGRGRRDEAEAAVGNEANKHARQAITPRKPAVAPTARLRERRAVAPTVMGADAVRYTSVASPPGPPTARRARRHQAGTATRAIVIYPAQQQY